MKAVYMRMLKTVYFDAANSVYVHQQANALIESVNMITLKIHSLGPTNHAMILSHLRPHALLRQVFRDHVARDGSLLVLRGGIVDGQHLDLMCFIAVG